MVIMKFKKSIKLNFELHKILEIETEYIGFWAAGVTLIPAILLGKGKFYFFKVKYRNIKFFKHIFRRFFFFFIFPHAWTEYAKSVPCFYESDNTYKEGASEMKNTVKFKLAEIW